MRHIMDGQAQTEIDKSSTQRPNVNPEVAARRQKLKRPIIFGLAVIATLAVAYLFLSFFGNTTLCEGVQGKVVSRSGAWSAGENFCVAPWLPTPRGGMQCDSDVQCLGGVCTGFWTDMSIGGKDTGGGGHCSSGILLFGIR